MSQFNQQQNQIAICQQCGAKYRRGTTHNCVAQIREEYDLKFQQQDQKLNDLQNFCNQLQQNLNRVSNEPRPGTGYGALNQGNFGISPDQQQLTSQIKFQESKTDWVINEVKEKFKSTENRIYAMNKEIGALQSNRCCVHCNMEPRIQKIISPNEQLFENQWGYAKPNDNNMGNYFHQQQQQQHPNNNFKRQERQQDQNYREKSPNLLRQDIGQQNFNERVPINRQPINNYDVQGRLLHKSRDTSMDNRPAFQTKQNSFSGFPEDQVTPGVYYDHQKKNASSEFLQDPPIFNQIQQQQPIQNRNQQQQRQPLQYQQNQQHPLFDSSIFALDNPNLPQFNQQNNQRQQQQFQDQQQHHLPNQFQQQQQQRDSRQNMNQNQYQRHDLFGADIFQNEPENNIRYIDNGREVEIKQNAPMLRKFVLQQLQENNIDQSCRSQQLLGEKIQMALLTYIEKYPDYFKKNYSYVLFNLGRVNTAEQSLKIQQQLCQLLEDKDCFGSINYYNERLSGLLVMELNVQKILQEFTVNNFEQQAQFDKVFEEDIEQRIKQKWVRCERFLMFYN